MAAPEERGEGGIAAARDHRGQGRTWRGLFKGNNHQIIPLGNHLDQNGRTGGFQCGEIGLCFPSSLSSELVEQDKESNKGLSLPGKMRGGFGRQEATP